MAGAGPGSGGWQWGESYPKDIRMEVNPSSGTIPVQTSDNYGPESGIASAGMPNKIASQAQGQGAGADVAGVLKRNQACLQCRRRKLKCDAVRPHCATCIRSHKHTLRTSPSSGAVLTCDYDDGPAINSSERPSSSGGAIVGSSEASAGPSGIGKGGRIEHEHSPASGDEDPSGQARKKRKPTGQSAGADGRKKKENEADKLRRKIEELEAQLANKPASPTVTEPHSSTVNPAVDMHSHPWAFAPVGFDHSASSSAPHPNMPAARNDGPISAQSPTAFLEMLSSAATAQPSRPTVSSGLKEGKTGTTMVTGGVFAAPTPLADLGQSSSGTGLTPFFTYDPLNDSTLHAGQVTGQEERPQIVSIDSDPSTADLASANGRDTSYSFSGPSMNGNGDSRQSSGVYGNSSIPPLTPSAIFNFPPTPAASGAYTTNGKAQSGGMGYVPQFNADGSMKPSEKLDGPWRAVETVETFLAGASMPAAGNMAAMDGMGMGNGNTQFSAQDAAEGMMSDLPPLDEAMQQQLLMDLFWPGWPANLPEPNIVNDLIEAFFELVPGLPRLLHRGRFLARMALPPTHSNFPHPALIHSMCSIASNWCAPALYERSNLSRAFDPKTGKEWNFALRQAALAKDQVHEGLNTGNRMFDVVRAMMILSRIFIDDTRMLECWAYNGLVARMILPLGLNVRSAGLSLKSVMLPPPADAIEREERRASMWFAVYHDTIASAASGWGTSVALDELSIPLPVSAKDFESGSETLDPNPQDLDSPDLYTRHPVPDPFVMVLKASVLLNRVNKFARKWKNRHVRDHDDYEGMARGEFRELANSIACFQKVQAGGEAELMNRMSFPPELRNPCKMGPKRKLDVDLIAAHLMPHAAIICLYEPFANLDDPGDQAAQRILNAAQAIVGTVQQMAALVQEGVQNFTTVMHSSTSICLVTSARTCLLFYRHALNQGNTVMAESLRMDVEMIRIALAQLGLKFKIGHHHAQLVEYFMDRATNPTYDKMSAHYPEHPRPGAPVLHPGADLGVCVMNALNVKRGYWRIANPSPSAAHAGPNGANQGYAQQTSDGISPFGSSSTPGSTGASGSVSGGTSYTTMSSGSNNATKGWSTQMPSAGTYPDPPDARELLCQTTGNVAKSNEEARIRSASRTMPNSASGSASHSPANITGTAMTSEPAAQPINGSMMDYINGAGNQAGKVGVDDGSSTIGWMLPYIGAAPGTGMPQAQAQQQQQQQLPTQQNSTKPDRWAIIDQLFTRPRADGTRDAFGLTAQERGAVGNASLGARTGVVAEVQVQGGSGMAQPGGSASFSNASGNDGGGGAGGKVPNGIPRLPNGRQRT